MARSTTRVYSESRRWWSTRAEPARSYACDTLRADVAEAAARRSGLRLATARVESDGAEWVGGCLPTPFFVGGEGEEPCRAEIAIWLEQPSGLILAQQVLGPGDAEGAPGRALRAAMEHPIVGPARRPPAIRVADAALEAEVRAVLGDATPIRVAPTPELDEVLEIMASSMAGKEEEPGYLEGGRVRAETVAALFAAARRLYLARPWSFADDDQVLRLDVPALGVEGACVSVIGALGEARGVVIFPSLAAFDAFCAACDRTPRKRGRVDLGSSWIGLHFEPRSELAPAMLREIDAHGFEVAGPDAYPRLEHVERDGASRPLSDADFRIATAAAGALGVFVSRHRRSFAADEIEPICESYFDADDLEAVLTIPYEAYDLFERAPTSEPAAPLPAVRPGRNDPCPCGSGKKFKKCHLGAYEANERAAAGVSPLHRLDERLRTTLGLFAAERFGLAWRRRRVDFRDPIESAQLALPWSVYHQRMGGRPVFEWFLEERGRTLTREERAWLVAQRTVWLSVWEVTEVVAGRSLTLRDLLSGEVRRVQEVSATGSVVVRSCLLARVVEHESQAVLCGAHPRQLPPSHADGVVQRARARLRRRREVPSERLRDEKLGRYLIELWEESAFDLERGLGLPRELRTTSGDPLLVTVDRFAIAAGGEREIGARLASMDDVAPPQPDDDEPSYVFLAPEGEGGGSGRTVLGRAWLARGTLHVETLSRERADALRRRVEDACGERIRHRTREHEDPLSRSPRRKPVRSVPQEAPPPEAEQLVLEFKTRHYADWADHPLPALGGETPRAAVRTAKGRAAVDVLLKDMEHGEQTSPPASRFDFGILRRELGLEP